MSQKSIWLGTVGLGKQFGGVAHVARCSLAALTNAESNFRLEHIVSLLDSAGDQQPDAIRCVIKSCAGSRIRFTASVLSQVARRPDVVLFDHVDIAQCQTFLPKLLRSPYAVWVHGIEVWKQLPPRKLQALRGAELLIFNSKFTRSRFESFHGTEFLSQVVHLTGGDSEQQLPSQQPRKPWILTVGRLEPDRPKGHAEILAAFPAIVRAVPDVQWHIVGKGAALEAFRQQAAESSCADQIHLHGFLDDDELQRLFCQSRVFAMPSFGEGFGIVYLEAMQNGCIPLGSTLDAAPEVIGDGGVCVDVKNKTSLESTVIELLNESDEQFQQRSKRARARVAGFSTSQFNQKLLAALDGLMR